MKYNVQSSVRLDFLSRSRVRTVGGEGELWAGGPCPGGGNSDNTILNPPPKKRIFRGGETLFCESIALFVSLSALPPSATFPSAAPPSTGSAPPIFVLSSLLWFLRPTLYQAGNEVLSSGRVEGRL